MQRWLIQLIVNVPIIKSYVYRKRWHDKFDDNVTFVAIYNNGRSLYLDPFYRSAVTHYDDKVWEWIFYRDFCEPKFILANKNFCKEKPTKPDMIVLQHLGHDEYGNARVLTISSPARKRPEHIKIPRQHILYLAVRNGLILGNMTVFQPLPCKLFNSGYKLRPIAKWFAHAKQLKFLSW